MAYSETGSPWPEVFRRADSGFADDSTATTALSKTPNETQAEDVLAPSAERPTSSTRTKFHSTKMNTNQTTPTASPRRPGGKSSPSGARTLSLPITSDKNASRRSSKTRDSSNLQKSSRASSRRSSFTIAGPNVAYTRKLSDSRPSSGVTYARPSLEDPFLFHYRCKSLFQSHEDAISNHDPRSQTSQYPTRTSSQSSISPTYNSIGSTNTCYNKSPSREHSYSNHVPSTTIDWTLPSTRRLEYQKIDNSFRGLRGLWRRFTPRCCRKGSRMGFYDEDRNSDSGSVRRYRIELPRGENEKVESEVAVEEKEPRVLPNRARRRWT
ncbi:hypothetical protein MMC12_005374 [Toensbergia leucococca]|nr:hypothetical protein [Toensbergia leucococca]